MPNEAKMNARAFEIANYVYSPHFRPIKRSFLSLVTLDTIFRLKKCNLKKIKNKINEDYGLEIQSEDVLEKILDDLKKEHYIKYEDYGGEIVTKCTPNGEQYCNIRENEYNKIVLSAYEYFENKLKDTLKKHELSYLSISNENLDSLKEKFFECLNYISKEDLENKIIKSSNKVKYLSHFKSLTDIDKKIIDICDSLCIDLLKSNKKKRPEEVQKLLALLYYNSVASFIFHDPILGDFFRQDLDKKKICLDTNALIAAVTNQDSNHTYMRFLLTHIKRERKGNINIFWFEETKDEFDAVFNSSYKLIKAIESYPSANFNQIVNMHNIPTFVKDYLKDNWYNLDSYKEHIYYRYKKLEDLSKDTLEKNQNIQIDPEIKTNIENYLLKERKTGDAANHDIMMLAKLISLRKQSLSNQSLIADYWLITFDRLLINYAQKKLSPDLVGKQPMCIGINALKLLMEPYITATSIIETYNPNVKYIPISINFKAEKLEDIDFQNISFGSLNKYQEMIAEYIKDKNIEEFGI